jgi:hypothetical protein
MYSPDGHALFVTTERGWYLWSVYGHLLASNHLLERSIGSIHEANGFPSSDRYMDGLRDCCWAWSGLGAILLGLNTRSLYLLPFARSAVTNCYNPVPIPFILQFDRARIPLRSQSYRLKTLFFSIKGFISKHWTSSTPNHGAMHVSHYPPNISKTIPPFDPSLSPQILAIYPSQENLGLHIYQPFQVDGEYLTHLKSAPPDSRAEIPKMYLTSEAACAGMEISFWLAQTLEKVMK